MADRARKLNVVFALSSIGMLIVFTLMIWDDYDRDWKKYQKAFNKLEVKVTQEQAEQAKAQVPTAQQQAMQDEMARAKQDEASKRDAIKKAQGERDKLEGEWYAIDQNYRFTKAEIDVARYDFEEARHKDTSSKAKKEKRLDDLEARWAKLRQDLEDVNARKDAKDKEIAQLEALRLAADKKQKEVYGGVQPAGGPPLQDPARLRDHRAQPARARPGQPVAEGQPDHAREPPGRRHLLGHAEGGPLHDLPSRHRQEGVRDPGPALHHPSQPRLLPPGAAPDRQGGLHLLPPGTRARHRLRERGAHPVHRGPGEGVGEEVPALGQLPPLPLLGLPDDGQGPHRGPVREVPSGSSRSRPIPTSPSTSRDRTRSTRSAAPPATRDAGAPPASSTPCTSRPPPAQEKAVGEGLPEARTRITPSTSGTTR